MAKGHDGTSRVVECRCRYDLRRPLPAAGGTVECGRCGHRISHTVAYCRFVNVLELPWVSGPGPWCPDGGNHRKVLSEREAGRVLTALRKVGVAV